MSEYTGGGNVPGSTTCRAGRGPSPEAALGGASPRLDRPDMTIAAAVRSSAERRAVVHTPATRGYRIGGDECHHEADHGTRLGQRAHSGDRQHSTSTLRSECRVSVIGASRYRPSRYGGTPAPPQPDPVLRSRRKQSPMETTLGNILIAFRENRRRTSTLTAVSPSMPAELFRTSQDMVPALGDRRRSTKTPVPRSDPRLATKPNLGRGHRRRAGCASSTWQNRS